MNTTSSLLNKIRRRTTTNMENVTEQNQLLKVEREGERKMKEHIESNTQRIERLEQRFEACELGTEIQPESVVRSETLPLPIQCTNEDLLVHYCTHPEPDGLQSNVTDVSCPGSLQSNCDVIEGRGGAVLAVNEDECPTSLLSNSDVNDGSSPGGLQSNSNVTDVSCPGSLQSNCDVIEGRGAVTSESGKQRRGDATLESVIQRRDIKEIHEPDYEIGELISSGGFGKVHEGQWESKMVAVKRITVTEGGMAVIEKEIKFNGLVKHPNIVVLHAYCKYKPGTSSNICFDLIMDFIKGFTLHDALFVHKVRNLKISEGRLLTAQKISAALDHVHSKRCTHSDIKTDNILIREQDNEPFICDLGLAHGVTHSAVTDISSGRRQRAPVWYPPESLVKGEHPVASYKADVWAMGRVLLEIFTGRPVWEGLSQGSDEVPPDSIIIGHLMHCHFDENHDVTPHTIKYVEDKSVRDLIRRCFSAKPNERPSAKNLADQFGEFLNKKETSSSNRPTVSNDDYVDMK